MRLRQLREQYEEDYEDRFEEFVLPAGTTVYHGTSSEDFNERTMDLDPPYWVTDAPDVAEWFAKRFEGSSRVITFQTTDDLRLMLIHDAGTFQEVEDIFGENMSGDPTEMAEAICRLGYDGWNIPDNYPSGADIVICRPALSYVETTPVS